jgi:hypothetical protein
MIAIETISKAFTSFLDKLELHVPNIEIYFLNTVILNIYKYYISKITLK